MQSLCIVNPNSKFHLIICILQIDSKMSLKDTLEQIEPSSSVSKVYSTGSVKVQVGILLLPYTDLVVYKFYFDWFNCIHEGHSGDKRVCEWNVLYWICLSCFPKRVIRLCEENIFCWRFERKGDYIVVVEIMTVHGTIIVSCYRWLQLPLWKILCQWKSHQALLVRVPRLNLWRERQVVATFSWDLSTLRHQWHNFF